MKIHDLNNGITWTLCKRIPRNMNSGATDSFFVQKDAGKVECLKLLYSGDHEIEVWVGKREDRP